MREQISVQLREPLKGLNRFPFDTMGGVDTADDGFPIYKRQAATTLSLWLATVFRRGDLAFKTEGVQQCFSLIDVNRAGFIIQCKFDVQRNCLFVYGVTCTVSIFIRSLRFICLIDCLDVH